MSSGPDFARRQEIGDRFILGSGYEIGAGGSPSRYRGMNSTVFLDKRSSGELSEMFRCAIDYEVRSVSEPQPEADFVIAHHVLEHSPNPIGELVEWSKLIRLKGRMFISIPAADHVSEKERLPAPFDHLLDDYLFRRNDASFESKQHVPHFINQWAYMEPTSFWYSQGNVREFTRVSLLESARDGNDLHWHTYTFDVLKSAITAAFWFSGYSANVLHAEHAVSTYYTVVEKGRKGRMPQCLANERLRLQLGLDLLGRPRWPRSWWAK